MADDMDEVAKAHVAGIDLSHRAPELPPSARAHLPQPVLPARQDWLALYWRAWAIAYDQLRDPDPASGLVPFCDAAFSDNIFQWDTCFMVGFLRYAPSLMRAAGSLDNFYRKQHAGGFICREINAHSGEDCWALDHPSAVNPPLFAEAEWALYQITGDTQRLAQVLPAICRYDRWLRSHRRAGDGTGYWTTALASGMDNSPRTRGDGRDVHLGYGYTWLCLTAQQARASQLIAAIAEATGDQVLARRYAEQASALTRYVDDRLWNGQLGYYADLSARGSVTDVLTPACCWPLLLPDIDPAHRVSVLALLRDPRHFWRPHGVPSLAASDPEYAVEGNYWMGSVWPPMVQLAVRAAQASDERGLARALAANHLDNVFSVYEDTGTLWENYQSERVAQGNIARPEFVGWTGCGPIGMLLETILGLEVSAPNGRVTWYVDRDDHHGVRRLPVGAAEVNLEFQPQTQRVSAQTTGSVTVRLVREGRRRDCRLAPGTTELTLP